MLGLWKYFVFNYSFSISITKIPPCVCVHFVSYFKKFAQEMVETSCIYSSNNPIWYFLLIYMNECVVHLGLKGFCFCVFWLFEWMFGFLQDMVEAIISCQRSKKNGYTLFANIPGPQNSCRNRSLQGSAENCRNCSQITGEWSGITIC